MSPLNRGLRVIIHGGSGLILALACAGFLCWATPKVAARLAVRSASPEHVLERLRAIAAAQEAFRAARARGEERFGELSELEAGGYLEKGAMAAEDDGGALGGYRFVAAPSPVYPAFFWWAAAEDVNSGRCFYLNQGGVIYAADRPVRPRSDADTEPDQGVPIGAR